MQVCNITTPANYFHVLRRQMHRDFRKPLIVMSPKSLLRHKRAVSTLDDMTAGRTFHRVLWDAQPSLSADANVRRVLLCSGKVYYDLWEAREAAGVTDVVALRLEQLYPWPEDTLLEELARFPNADVVWMQDEPKNAGAWSFAAPRIDELLVRLRPQGARVRYVGAPEMASPAPGSLKRHQELQRTILEEALAR